MAGLYGADADELDRFGQQLLTAAARLETIRGEVGSAFGRAQWDGDDAHHFHDLWQHQLSGRLQAASAATRDAAGVVSRNARQQRDASATDGGMPYRGTLGDPGEGVPWNPLDPLGRLAMFVGGVGVAAKGLAHYGLPAKLAGRLEGAGKIFGKAGNVIDVSSFAMAAADHDTRGMKVSGVDLAADVTFKVAERAAAAYPPALIVVGGLEMAYAFVPDDAKVAAADLVIDAGKQLAHAAEDVGHAAADVGGAVGGIVSGGFNGIKKAFHW